MGIQDRLDKAKERAKQNAERGKQMSRRGAEKIATANDVAPDEPPPAAKTAGTEPAEPRTSGDHYDAVVNRGSLSVRSLNSTLNKRWKDGWRLAHMFEQKGNTVIVFERRS